jgi:hypothetical protein
MDTERTITGVVLLNATEARIAELWEYRHWWRTHRWADWPEERRDLIVVELRALVKLLRTARQLAAPAVEQADAFTAWKRARDIDLADGDHFAGMEHLPSSRVEIDNVEGDPAFNGSFR